MSETSEVTQEQFEQAVQADLASVSYNDASDAVYATEGGEAEETIGGGADTIVNAASQVIELLDNSASVNASDYANALPQGVDSQEITGWESPAAWISLNWKASSEWWELWHADYDFTVGVSFYFGGSHNGHGRYLDFVTPYLDVRRLPPDFSVDVTVIAPDHGLNLGTVGDPIAALPFNLAVTLKGFFGQLVTFRQNYRAQVRGTGGGEWG